MPLKSRINKLEKHEQKAPMALDWPHDYDPPAPVDWVFETAYEKIASSADEWVVSDILEAALASGLYSGEEELMDRASEFILAQANKHQHYDSPLKLLTKVLKDWLEDKTLFVMNEDCEDCGYFYPSHREQAPRHKPGNYRSVTFYRKCLICGGAVGDDAWWKKNTNRKGSHLYAHYPYDHVWERIKAEKRQKKKPLE